MKAAAATLLLLVSQSTIGLAQTKEQLSAAPCAIEFDLGAMAQGDQETLPTALREFLPKSLTLKQVNEHVFRIAGHGAKCGQYAATYLGDPSSFAGLQLRKIIPSN
jgi:hypothetical protein